MFPELLSETDEDAEPEDLAKLSTDMVWSGSCFCWGLLSMESRTDAATLRSSSRMLSRRVLRLLSVRA